MRAHLKDLPEARPAMRQPIAVLGLEPDELKQRHPSLEFEESHDEISTELEKRTGHPMKQAGSTHSFGMPGHLSPAPYYGPDRTLKM